MSTGLSDADVAFIGSLAQLWDSAGLNADWESMAHTLADDFTVVMQGAPPIEGKAAWLEFVRPFPPLRQTTTVDEIDGAGDVAYMWGRGEFHFDGSEPNSSRFILILRKQEDGSWLCTREMMAFDKPFDMPA